jgi:polysaccharide biosynthesis protein PslH
MNILFIISQPPWPLISGGRQRAFHLINALVQKHRLTLAVVSREPFQGSDFESFPLLERCARVVVVEAPGNDGRCCAFHPWAPLGQRLWALASSFYPNQIRSWRSDKILKALQKLQEREQFDAVWVERPFIAELARRSGFRRLVVDVDNIETICQARQMRYTPWYPSKALHWADLFKMYVYELMLPYRYWRLVVCKEEDRSFFKFRNHNVFVVPNGIEDCLSSSPEAEGSSELLFVGSLNYEPNVDAVEYFVKSIFPRLRSLSPKAQFRVVGRGPMPASTIFRNGDIAKVHVDVPEVAPFFEAASVVVVPMRMGSGTRLKVMEALVRGKAVVATPTAIEGIDLRVGIDVEVAETPEAFASACARLLADPVARRRLGASGRLRVLQSYRWKTIGSIANRVLAGGEV